jgi:hypothetical protein
MFGDVAIKLLRLMGHSGTVPSALLADDVAEALRRLEAAVEAEKTAVAEQPPNADLDDERREEPRVSLAQRAFPLIQLLEAAAAKHSDVMWDSRGSRDER